MASTYSSLKIQLMTTGENLTTWGTVTNTNLGTAIEEAITGSADVTFASGNVTLTLTNTNATQTARNLRLNLTGTTGGARDLIVPAIEKVYIVNNGCADTVTIKVTGQTGVAVPAGKTMYVYNNGTDCTDAITHLRNLTLATALPIASGGTGATSETNARTNLGLGSIATQDANNVSITGGSISGITDLAVADGGTGASTFTTNSILLGNGSSSFQTLTPGTSGNVATSNGTTWTSTALPVTFSTGMIMMWAGSIATIPSGWALCNGSNGTPDLRDRFVVGAGSTYAVAATGGSKDAIVVSHTHAFSSTTSSSGAHQHNINSIETAPRNVNLQDDGYFSGDTGNLVGTTATAGAHTHTVSGTTDSTGSSGTNANLPPYYALAYIMKL